MNKIEDVIKAYECKKSIEDKCNECPYFFECDDKYHCECGARDNDTLYYLKEYRELTKELVERTKIDEKNGYSAGRHNEDCYWFDSVQDMGAHIPTCDYFGRLGYCPCDNCDKYITNRTISKIVKHIYESER
jgi:hypothetical protein